MSQQIERITVASQPGFRLHKLEVLNWGTFTRQTWKITPGGTNSLLTGDIGSGKSTLVDALTTLLVPYQKITYNKAAGAESKERTVYSYIRGAYKNEKTEHATKAQDVFLRDENTYSVIAALFYNENLNQTITLAQVFWLKNNKPEKLFIVSAKELSIKKDFSDFGTDISQLRKRLRKAEATEVFDTFSDYSNKFRQFFGIRQPEALDLFYQTVSMKSVGNLTEFVREHMLGKTDVNEKIQDLVNRYEELTDAYNSVKKARLQLELLKPLIENLKKHDQAVREVQDLQRALDYTPVFFSTRKIKLLQNDLQKKGEEYNALSYELREIEKDLGIEREKARQLKNLIENSEVWKRLHSIEKDIERVEEQYTLRKSTAGKYEKICREIELPCMIEEVTFLQNRTLSEKKLIEITTRLSEIRSELNTLNIELHKKQTEESDLRKELNSLKSRKTLIPERVLAMRQQMLDHLRLDEEELPFAGELIRVKESEAAWEGAIERRLHDLGISLLVPDRHYHEITNYVNKTNLKGKLVYFRVLERELKSRWEPGLKSLVNKVEIKSDSEFYEWLEAELEERHNFICCDTIEEFRREQYAITREGQIKSGKSKHEKDDRRDISDKRNFVLGWTNLEKIKALEKDLLTIQAAINKLNVSINNLEKEEAVKDRIKDLARDLLQYQDFNGINWKKSFTELTQLQDEKKQLEENSNEIKSFEKQLKEVDKNIARLDSAVKAKNKTAGSLEADISRNVLLLKENLAKSGVLPGELDSLFNLEESIFENILHFTTRWSVYNFQNFSSNPQVENFINSLLKDSISLDNIEKEEKQVIARISGNGGIIEEKNKVLSGLQTSVIRVMSDFKRDYPAETMEIDASLEAGNDFRRIFDNLVADDIPKYEARFRQLLKEGTINGILIFKNQLEIHEKEVLGKIRDINLHLKEIDYSPGTFITIVEEKVLSEDIKQFRLDLKNCLENILGETDHYNEEKFLQVKKILDRFKGENEEDRRWMSKVTDVREWYTFGASERYREDENEEKEFYSDSSGKSGGQKEKLAYTILASSIAFQFGLGRHDTNTRSFRFVVIDEAFGRGSDDSTRYGLKLFETLNLQLLIVTPMQKINVIEEYINTVHFVSNPTGQSSMVSDIGKEQYKKMKEEYFAALQSDKQ